MKKGLRLFHGAFCVVVGQNRRPDEEGIKTLIKTSEKKNVNSQNRRPDEEGIKTLVSVLVLRGARQNRRPDEEGIKTLVVDALRSCGASKP